MEFECPHCFHEFEVEVEPYIPPRNMHGRMEDAIPAEGGTCSPDACPECDCYIADDAFMRAETDEEDAREAAAEAKADAQRELREEGWDD